MAISAVIQYWVLLERKLIYTKNARKVVRKDQVGKTTPRFFSSLNV